MASSRKKNKSIDVSIFIPTYNGDRYLEELLSAIHEQDTSLTFEVIIIDSGSSDKTLSIISKFPEVLLHTIPNSDFGHGKTRNKAAEIAHGKYMVFLSQDATPASKYWLDFMIEPFLLNELVCCVFGKQTPRLYSDAPTKREVSGVFESLGADHSIMISRKNSLLNGRELPNYLTFFSDVNSVVKRDFLLDTIPYRDVPYSEDQLLGSDVLNAGFLKAYAPLGNVWHSNEYSIGDYRRRKFDEYVGMYETLGVLPSGGIFVHCKRWAKDTLLDIPFILKDRDYSIRHKILNICTSWLRNLQRQRASLLVLNPNARMRKQQSLEKKVKEAAD